MKLENIRIAIIGLGYVGLPLAIEFGKKVQTVGFDIDEERIKELKQGKDKTLEVKKEDLDRSAKLSYSTNVDDIRLCNIYIITVPTPITKSKEPDLIPLIKSTKTVGKVISKGDIVIYESTVYPGATEEVCVPILERKSGFEFNRDFYCGYSPERINPGDKEHGITNIIKVTSGSTPEVADIVDNLYRLIITAGTFRASSIKVAEAAKVIENTQRDVNIALINELSIIFNKLNIDSEEVLRAAESKWNFISFRPGLVGGHCIGVDPYYLTHKAVKVGYQPEIILAGRRINDNMGSFIVGQVTNLMTQKKIKIVGAKILIMGLTFKENCPDIRNTGVINLVKEFNNLKCNVDIYDSLADTGEVKREYNLTLVKKLKKDNYDVIVLAVAHEEINKMSSEKIRKLGRGNHILYDIKHIFDAQEVDGRL